MKYITQIALSFLMFSVGYATDFEHLQQEDNRLKSGTVNWHLNYEVFEPSSDIPIQYKPADISVSDFDTWNLKQKEYRSQEYLISATFKGNHLHFECNFDQGDVNSVAGMQSISYSGNSISFIDHILGNMYKNTFDKNFISSPYNSLLISPKFCGYNTNEIIKLVSAIKGSGGNPLQISTANSGNNKIRTTGVFPNGEVTLAEFIPASPESRYCSVIKFINPGINERVMIENSEWFSYVDGTVFPNKTVITRFRGGDLVDLSNSPKIDRKTLTVEFAEFNQEISDEVFNPVCPEGYTDLDKSDIAIN